MNPLLLLFYAWLPVLAYDVAFPGPAPEAKTRGERFWRRAPLLFAVFVTVAVAGGLVYGIATGEFRSHPCLREHVETKPQGKACFFVLVGVWCVPVEDTQTVCDERAP